MKGYLKLIPVAMLAVGFWMTHCGVPVVPVDPITPVDPVNPNPVDPITPEKLQIVILEDPALRASLPSQQVATMDGQELRSYAETHCVVTDGTPDLRVLSIRQDVSKEAEWIQLAFKQPRDSLPHLVVMTAKQLISGPLPKTTAETMALLKKYGGE